MPVMDRTSTSTNIRRRHPSGYQAGVMAAHVVEKPPTPLKPRSRAKAVSPAFARADLLHAETQTGIEALAQLLPIAPVETSAFPKGQNSHMLSGSTGHGSAEEREARLKQMAEAAKNIEVPTGTKAICAFLEAEAKREQLGEPTNWLQKLVMSHNFDLVAGVLICLNALVMMVQLEYGGEKAFLIFDHLFCWVFLAELALRVVAFKSAYLKVKMNWMDVVTVLLSVFELYTSPVMSVTVPNSTFIRLLRLLKLVKVLRIIRVLRLFHQLRVLIVAMSASISALAWSIFLVAIIQFIAAIFLSALSASITSADGAIRSSPSTR
mmetsp:Transcript_150489/g.481707  ORF Transcript_150489/g.481707 Transcript_150489/m.481707 type:complete len:322 (+) Transcript_150489:217-1182(+)